MSTWYDSFSDDDKAGSGRESEWDSFLVRYPNLGMLLLGHLNEKGEIVVTPGSMTMWVADCRLKVCLKIKAQAVCGFHTIDDPMDVFGELEAALNSSRIEWRKEGGRRRT